MDKIVCIMDTYGTKGKIAIDSDTKIVVGDFINADQLYEVIKIVHDLKELVTYIYCA